MKEPINKFMQKMHNYYSTFQTPPTLNVQRRILTPGNTEMFAFEKFLDSRSDVQNVSLGYERVYSISCMISQKQDKTNPIIVV